MSHAEREHQLRPFKCPEIGALLPFYACDELDAQEREAVEAHLARCKECAAHLEQERKLLEALDSQMQPADELNPSDALLAQCRSELAEKLDDLAAPSAPVRWRPFGWLRQMMVLRPAWSAALLLAIGVALGTQASRLGGGGGVQTAGPAINIRATPTLSEEQLSQMQVDRVNFSPSPDAGPGTVQVQLSAEQPFVVSGNADDTDVRRVLTYVVANGERFDPGVRLDCLDALKTHTSETDVRQALLTAARKDSNPAVRLKVLEALRDSTEDEAVRQVLLDVLSHDTNPGIRVEAVNLLVRSLQDGDAKPALAEGLTPPTPAVPPAPSAVPVDPSVNRVLHALGELTRKDPSRYVRLRSAAALRQIGPRDTQ